MKFCDSCTYVDVNPVSMPCRECNNYNKYEEARPKTIENYREELYKRIANLGNILIPDLECNYFKNTKLVKLDDVLELLEEEME